jgi:ubiquinol-cytochrome c reductase cytochrome c1 subunit
MLRRSLLAAAACAVALLQPFAAPRAHADNAIALLKTDFPFYGVFGTYDKATLQRGFQVYKEVCSTCHGLYELSYRNLGALGYSADQVKAIAAGYQTTDGPNDNGEMFQRPGIPSDLFARPFANEQAARAANNGAYPPDLAMIVNARKGGPYYVYSLMQGFVSAPAGTQVPDGMYYNTYFPGHMIAMPPPLTDGAVTFADGAPNDLRHEAYDVASFLQWASDPTLDQRHRMGLKVIIFLVVTSVILYLTKRKIWAKLH